MKIAEFFDSDDRYNVGQSDEDILYEMANFSPRVTGLPTGIDVWTRTDPINHGHNRYRVKILKDREYLAIFSVGKEPKLVKNINNTLTDSEQTKITNWIANYSSLIISLIDNKLDTAEFGIELMKARGM